MIKEKEASFKLSDHFVIIAFDYKIEKILQCIFKREKSCQRMTTGLLIADRKNTIPWETLDRISNSFDLYRVIGDPADLLTLRIADVEKANNVIILSDDSEGIYADAKSILIVLALKSISRKIQVSVEVVDPDNISSLKLTRADHIISIPNLREKLLAQAAVTHYVSHIYSELLDMRKEQNLASVSVGLELLGKTVREARAVFYDRGMILVAIMDRRSGSVRINPQSSYVITEDDSAVVISKQEN